MAKYKTGQKLQDIEDGSIFTILAVAPTLDYQGFQQYWCEVIEIESNIKYFVSWDEELFDKWAKLIQ